MPDVRRANTDFKTAGGGPKAPDLAALIVDVQLGCICHMAPDDAQNYLSSLAGQINQMRDAKTPIAWATVDDHTNTKFHGPSGQGQDVRSTAELKDMGFYAIAPQEDPDKVSNKALFDQFILAHGPRENEAVFTKPAFNAFGTSERDRVDANIPLEAMPRLNAEHAKFTDHMKHTNAKTIAISGAVGSVCCLETAIGGRQNGLNTSLMLDGVVCWNGQGQKSQLVWREGFENAEDANQWHRSEIRQATQKPERGFSEADVLTAKDVDLITRQDLTGSSPDKYVTQTAKTAINQGNPHYKM